MVEYTGISGKQPIGSVLIMAGGKGGRIGNPLKFLLPLAGSSVLERLIIDVQQISDRIWICTTESSLPFLKDKNGIEKTSLIVGNGNGYHEDLNYALNEIKNLPVFVIPADTVIIDRGLLEFLTSFPEKTNSGLVNLKQNGEFTGISVFLSVPLNKNQSIPFEDVDISGTKIININTPEDYEKARELVSDQ